MVHSSRLSHHSPFVRAVLCKMESDTYKHSLGISLSSPWEPWEPSSSPASSEWCSSCQGRREERQRGPGPMIRRYHVLFWYAFQFSRIKRTAWQNGNCLANFQTINLHYLSEFRKELDKLGFLHVIVVEIIDNRCEQSKVEQLQR
jgi:hypothetical protein